MRRCHFPRLAGLLFATLALWPLSVVAQEVCVGDDLTQCTEPGSIYRTIKKLGVSGSVRANGLINAAATQLYVQTAALGGNDNNDCQASTPSSGHGPCRTINQTITNAIASGPRLNAFTINIGPGTFDENIAINGPFGASNTGFVGAASEPVIAFRGAGSGRTTVNGGNTVSGQPYCYTFLGNQHAAIVLSGMTLKATHNPSCGSAIYVQFHGYVHVLSDIIIDATNGPSVLGEEGGVVEVNPGGQTAALTFQGSTTGAVALSAKAMFQSDVPIVFAGNPTYTIGAFVAGQDSHIKLSGSSAISGTFNGPRIALSGNSSIFTASGASLAAAGSVGTATTGGVWEGVPSATVTSQTGMGTTGGATIDAGGDPYHGTIRLNPNGTGIGSSGNLFLSMPYKLLGGGCVVGVSNSGASWSSTPWFTMTDSSETPQIGFVNGAVFTGALQYVATYVCRS